MYRTTRPTSRYIFTAPDNGIIALAVAPSTGALSQIGTPVQAGNWPGAAAVDPSGAFLFIANAGPAPGQESWNDVMSYTIATSGANAGTVPLAGLGAQFQTFNADGNGGIFLAIVE